MAQTTGIINGTDLVVFVHNGGSAGTVADYTAIAHLTDCSVSPSKNTRDISSKSSAGNAEHLPAQFSWTASASGLYSHDAAYGYSQLNTLFLAGTKVTLLIGDPTDGANLCHKGDAFLSSLPIQMPNEDNSSYSVEFTGTGSLQYGAASGLF